MASECIFCKIALRKMKAEIVYEDADVVAFRDIRPQAPTHILVIPRRHLADLNELAAGDDRLMGALVRAAKDLAAREGLAERGYRLVFNCGDDAGYTVHHVHVHLLGGRSMSWPPG